MKATLFGAALLLASSVWADPIGGPANLNCPEGSCQGATYTLDYSGTAQSVGAVNSVYRIRYTIDTSTYTGGGVAIDAAAIKVSSSAVSATLFAAPGGVGNWAVVGGGINAGGCSGSGGGFECADWIAAGVGVAVGGTLVWEFDMTIPNGSLITSLGGASIKARYVDANGRKIGDLVSEPITLQNRSGDPDPSVPEPTSVILSLGVAAIAMHLGRKKFA